MESNKLGYNMTVIENVRSTTANETEKLQFEKHYCRILCYKPKSLF